MKKEKITSTLISPEKKDAFLSEQQSQSRPHTTFRPVDQLDAAVMQLGHFFDQIQTEAGTFLPAVRPL